MATLAGLSQYFVAIGLAGFLIVLAYLLAMSQRDKNNKRKVLGQNKSKNKNATFNIYAQKGYNQLMRIPGVRKIVLRIRKRIETLSIYDEYTLRREVMKAVFTILAVILIVVLLLILVRPSVMVVFWILLGLVFLSGALIDFFVHRVEMRLLKQLKEFNNRVRFYYQQTKMVDDAIFDATAQVGPEMKIQAERIYEILTSLEPEKELAKYEEVAPTRFLKVIAGLSLLVKEQGDKFSEKGSAYLRGLSAINEELNSEILYRNKLSYQLRSLSTLTIVPIFFALPIKNWAIDKFPIMQSFYDSRIGFVSEVVVYASSLVCYLIIRKMREIHETSNSMGVKRVFWEEKIFKRVPFIEKICKALSPTPYTKKHFQLQQLIKDANSPLKIDWLMLHRILITLSVVIFLTGGLIFAHYREENSVLNSSLPSTLFAGELSEEEKGILQEQTAFDKRVIEDIKKSDTTVTEDEMKSYLAAQLGVDENDPQVKIAYDRIADKWITVKNAYLKWWEFALAIAIAFAASYTPIWNLQLKRYLRFKDMEIEVYQHLILISILKEFESMSVYKILEWIERFSIVFKEPVQIALQNFDAGPDEALNKLSIDVSFEGFQQIVERLRLSIIRISIQEAFDDIDIEREFYFNQRKEEQNRSVDSKGIMGGYVGLAPVMVLVFLYLVIPLIYISLIKTTDTMQLLQ